MSFDKKEPWWNAAAEAATTAGDIIPVEWIYGTLYYDSGSFASDGKDNGYNFGKFLQTENNSRPNADGSGYYMIFESMDAYAVYFGKQLASYNSLSSCKTIEEYVQCLKDNKYNPEMDLDVYPAQIRMAIGGDDVQNTKATGDGYAASTVPVAQKDDFGDKVEAAVQNHLGIPYVMGGDGVTSIDCGMFTLLVYQDVGIDLGNRCADEQYRLYKDANAICDLSSAKKGDLMFFQNTYDCNDAFDDVTHVGIFLGGDNMAQAGNPSKLCLISELGDWFTSHFYCCGHSASNNSLVGYSGTGVRGSSGGSSLSDADCDVKSVAPGGCVLVSVKPKGKTFCEPIYPDLVSVTGNVPKALAAAAVKVTSADANKTDDGLYTISLDKIQKATGMDFTGFFSDTKTIANSQQIFDATKFKNETKPATKGKPVNNTDPYPVDLKIEELETHQPRIKLQELKLPKPSAADILIAKAALLTGDRAEKRIVKLENMMSNLLRYIFAMGSRVNINCVYYGGQDRYAKYKAIRCLRDDRIEDGAQMQIDQCLTCTRYEPIIGQTYEILDTEYRPTLGQVLDDLQMAYKTMADEAEDTRVESYHTEKTAASQVMDQVKTRNAADKDFDKTWKAGYVQNWALTAVEQQKPSINWKQDINDTDKPKKHLASFQQSNSGSSISNGLNANTKISAGQMKSIMDTNYIAMQKNDHPEVASIIQNAMDGAGEDKVSSAIENMHSQGYEDYLIQACKDKGMDPLFVFAIIVTESTGSAESNAGLMQTVNNPPGPNNPSAGIDTGIEVYLGKEDAYDISNPVIVLTAYNSWCVGVDIGTIPPDILYPEMLFQYKDTWTNSENTEYFGKVCSAYHILENCNVCKTSLDQTNNATNSTQNLRFPFNDFDFKNITFYQDYDANVTADGATSSNFIGFTVTGDPIEVYAAGTGSVTGISGSNITVNIPSAGLIVTYYDVDTQSVSVGDSVTSDTLLGKVSQRLEVAVQDSSTNEYKDPKIYYAALSNKQIGSTLK